MSDRLSVGTVSQSVKKTGWWEQGMVRGDIRGGRRYGAERESFLCEQSVSSRVCKEKTEGVREKLADAVSGDHKPFPLNIFLFVCLSRYKISLLFTSL